MTHLFYRPTVLADVPMEAPAYQEEIFGPVAPIVGFKDSDEAARLATETECGLSLAILTTDIVRPGVGGTGPRRHGAHQRSNLHR
jgi:benzaldehyde dehydrogenase (NAD)